MLVLHNRLIGVPIMSLQTGTPLGQTAEPIIDPRRLVVVAFYCEGPLINFQPAILHIEDIRENSDIGFIIDGSDNIMPPDGLVRLKEILDFNFTLEGKQVVQEDGRKLGKVADYAVDFDSFYIMKLHVKPTFFQSLTAAEHIIDRSQIKAITDDKVIVNRAVISDKVQAIARPPEIENPFRKPAQTIDTKNSGR